MWGKVSEPNKLWPTFHSGVNVDIPGLQFVIRDKRLNTGHRVIPDLRVKPNILDLIQGKDPVLEAAFHLISQ